MQVGLYVELEGPMFLDGCATVGKARHIELDIRQRVQGFYDFVVTVKYFVQVYLTIRSCSYWSGLPCLKDILLCFLGQALQVLRGLEDLEIVRHGPAHRFLKPLKALHVRTLCPLHRVCPA